MLRETTCNFLNTRKISRMYKYGLKRKHISHIIVNQLLNVLPHPASSVRGTIRLYKWRGTVNIMAIDSSQFTVK